VAAVVVAEIEFAALISSVSLDSRWAAESAASGPAWYCRKQETDDGSRYESK
jgi:hypothetical protein